MYINVKGTPMTTSQRRVLIADDEAVIGIIISRVITPLGLTPTIVHDGAAAIAAARRYADELCCALMDIAMPGVDGVEAALVIHQLLPSLPIVLMSGSLAQQLTQQIGPLQLAGVLAKPFTLHELRRLLEQLGLVG
jgi:CheY-like chemotaxis protein